MLNGEESGVACRAKAGDVITLSFRETLSFDHPPQDVGLRVLFADEDISVVYKPAGVPSMPAAPHFDGNLFNGLKFLFPEGVFRVVTRLDKDTSGIVIVANNALSHSILHEEMSDVKKTYAALVCGRMDKVGEISAPIAATDTAKRAVHEGGKSAKTRIIAINEWGEDTLVTLQPVTGRTHQLRVHLSHIGHPIVGDALYGGGAPSGIDGEYSGGQLLCCFRVELTHPLLRQKMAFFIDPRAEIEGRIENFTINSQKSMI